MVYEGDRLLVIERSHTVEAPGMFCFPGGGIEPGEAEQEALVREMFEELGVAVEPVRSLWQSATAWRVQLSWWLARLITPYELQPNPAEVASVHWLTPAELAAVPRLLESNRHFLAALASGEIELT